MCVCVFTEVKRKEANQPPALCRFSRAVSRVSNYIFGRLLWYIYTIGMYVKGSESHEVAVESRLRESSSYRVVELPISR